MRASIRLATDTDVPAITAIYNQAIELGNATAHTEPVATAERRKWLADHPSDSLPVYIAELNDSVAGYCSISAYRPGRGALRHTREISYFVHEDFRARGIGSMLLRYVIDRCPELQIKTLFAILLENNPPSIALLEKTGFKKWGYMPGVADFDGTEVGHLYYGLRVASG